MYRIHKIEIIILYYREVREHITPDPLPALFVTYDEDNPLIPVTDYCV